MALSRTTKEAAALPASLSALTGNVFLSDNGANYTRYTLPEEVINQIDINRRGVVQALNRNFDPPGDACVPQSSLVSEDDASALGNFSAKSLGGGVLTPDIFKGKKLTMVNIWATYCGPCLEELPYLAELHEAYKDQGFQILGVLADAQIDAGDDDEAVFIAKQIIESTGADAYEHVIPDAVISLKKLSYVSSIPETLFVDENGAAVGSVFIGSRTKEDWQGIIEAMLAEK
jgi:thiol-disulfide isomerase/thioredoxin